MGNELSDMGESTDYPSRQVELDLPSTSSHSGKSQTGYVIINQRFTDDVNSGVDNIS